ncbi:USP5 [Cordylochernes scorpioides]|uniref:ubiquitinyl hydrolase 1 n=1 Tax=Cordylochernes scorpioides TaxID=51811 RepID=A0ABY6KLU2_9ARAC|nr:USP5 [Cordylochernes scorpioides]
MASYDLLKNHVDKIRTPQPGEKVYKDECVFSFDTPANRIYIKQKRECNNCNAKYVGETGRKLHNRIIEHRRNINRNDPLSLIVQHSNSTGHTFNLNEPKVHYNNINNKYQRLIIEAIETETGLYVCMNTFLGVGRKYLENFYRKTGNAVYLHIKRTRKEAPPPNQGGNGAQNPKPVKMAIGVAGGFSDLEKKYDYDEVHTIVILPELMTVPLPNVDLPENVQVSVACIIASEPAGKVEEAQALAGTWEGEKLQSTALAENLVQLDNGVKIPPTGWKCQDCELTDNLWLNLTDGAILCGRRYFDGRGGNNHAMQHYQQTGFPLVVKLGTITADGTADVYSYQEDNMVLDPHLAKHLSHFGINIANMTKETETGLYVCMNTFLGVGRKYLENFYRKTGNAVYLHIKRTRKEAPPPNQGGNGAQNPKPVKMAIGVAGGFSDLEKKYDYDEVHTIVILPELMTVPLPNVDLPENVQVSVACIIASEPAGKVEEAQALAGTWEGEKLQSTALAENLVQLDNGVKIPPTGWKCQDCELTDNLWLNLTDGAILCGRRYFDGRGGNNHAMQHYQQTGFPLVVKLGTITADGTADVYSYQEDNMVLDPHLAKHLSHFGINIANMTKSDKSMAELEIDLNQRYGEWAVLQESGSQLQPLFGPGYTGMANLGNSCYMNSVLQLCFVMQPFVERYYLTAPKIFEDFPEDPTKDFNLQMAKVAVGLLSGDYSRPPPEETDAEEWQSQQAIQPNMFKNLVGRGHPEFSTKRQQDAQEFLLYLINLLEKHNRSQKNPADCLRFMMEERLECGASKMVSYSSRTDYMLSLPVALENAINKEEVLQAQKKREELLAKGIKEDPNAEVVRPLVPLEACLQLFANQEKVEDFYSTAIQGKTIAIKTSRMASFPDYLIIHLKKFTIGDDWVPSKLDLSWLRAKGMQQGEVQLPEMSNSPPALQVPEFQFDEAMIAQLAEMGFGTEGCRRALYQTTMQAGGSKPPFDVVMNWIIDHMYDPDFNMPFHLPKQQQGPTETTNFVPEEGHLETIQAMGFNRDQALKALKATSNNLERALDWIFSHANELDEEMDTNSSTPPSSPPVNDGPASYKLVGFVSHMGPSSLSGHYVCHLLRDGHWVIYNDRKVALSEKPPQDLAYLYLYQRT